MTNNGMREVTPEQLLRMIYDKLLDLDLRINLLDANIQSLQQDVSRSIFVCSELIKIRYDHHTNELFITEHFRIPFEGNEATLLRHMFKKSNGLPKKSIKFYQAELAGKFKNRNGSHWND